MAAEKVPLLTRLLQDVSRSFYLTLRVLPSAVRPQLGLAYLLARATDTIADTDLVPVAQRLEMLARLRGRILGQTQTPLDWKAWVEPKRARPPGQASLGESALLDRIEEALALLHQLSPQDQTLIREVLSTITRGQEMDLERFGSANAQQIVALPAEGDLDDYTYRVAGCVGEFWTKICRRHLFPQANLDDSRLLEEGVRFGKGLQLINILRDLAKDLRQGRCYLPQNQLAQLNLRPEDLLHPAQDSAFRPLYDHWLGLAQEHLQAGWRYTCRLPRSCRRVRLACAWPLIIGRKTLTRLRTEPVLDPGRRVKVSRGEVRLILLRSTLLLPFPSAWEKQFEEATPQAKPEGSAPAARGTASRK